MTKDLVTTIAKKASEIGKLAGLDAGTPPWLVNFYTQYEASTKGGFESIYTLHTLYTALPKRQPLTDEQIIAIRVATASLPVKWGNTLSFAKAIEAAHGIREKS